MELAQESTVFEARVLAQLLGEHIGRHGLGLDVAWSSEVSVRHGDGVAEKFHRACIALQAAVSKVCHHEAFWL